MNILDPNTPLHEILMPAPELKQVFENLGIDACRDGGRPLVEVCQMQGLDSHTVVRLLTAFQAMPPRQVVALELMTLAELCDHLQETQRIKLREDLARLDQLTR
ncbi:MAG: hypothetical protein HYY23_14395, partial [Verrucomicrobia bacterium]|nr:hypothetical protein [Verrucomicrobiota bacterium]